MRINRVGKCRITLRLDVQVLQDRQLLWKRNSCGPDHSRYQRPSNSRTQILKTRVRAPCTIGPLSTQTEQNITRTKDEESFEANVQ